MPARVEVHGFNMTKTLQTSSALGKSVARLTGDGLRLDLSKLAFIRPNTLALICSYVDLIIHGDDRRRLAKQDVLVAEPRNPAAKHYLKGMNFYGAAQGQGIASMASAAQQLPLPLKPSEGTATQHVPLHPLRSSDDVTMIAIQLSRILLSKMPNASRGAQSAVKVTLGELLENFKAHSETVTRGGIVCAQYYPPARYQDTRTNRRSKGMRNDQQPRRRRGAIEIAVADTGIGIEASLRSNEEYGAVLDEVNPCEFATRLGITSKPDRHRGYGLFISRRLAEQNRGDLQVISGRHWFSIVGGVPRSGGCPHEEAWPGTFIGLKLFPEQPIDLNAIYAEISPPDIDDEEEE